MTYAVEQDQEIPVGFIVLRCIHHTEDTRSWNHFITHPPRTNWSYFITREHQGKGYGTLSAKLAIRLLLQAAPECPIELTTEQDNTKAQGLYTRLGFEKTDELDGDDFVFLYKPGSNGHTLTET
ncbi:MAG: GNAT family N-acetyltransferase [Ruminococcus flavefaciens]|nr:GNAT family N-acetyltransferase [Ruminococcus flavefaciens]